MKNFEAFVKGTQRDGMKYHYRRVDVSQFGIPSEFEEPFRLGLELNASKQVVNSGRYEDENIVSVQVWNETVQSINGFFGTQVVKEITLDTLDDKVTAVNPETGEQQVLKFKLR